MHVPSFRDQPRCAVCGNPRTRDLGRIAYGPSPIEFSSERIDVSGLEAHLLECTSCRARRTSPIVPAQVTADIYARAAAERWSGAQARFESTLRKARVEIPGRPGRVLDFGCFTGGLLDCFAQRGWRTFGVDLCADAVRIASERGHTCRAGSLDAVDFDESFEVIALFDVIEHLTDPRPTLTALRDQLGAQGELWILTGDAGSRSSKLLGARWWYVSFAEHVAFYRAENLEAVLRECGLKVTQTCRLRYFDDPPAKRLRNGIATGVYLAAHPLLAGRTTHRLGAGPPPLLAATDHLLVRATRA